jgi:archaellum biogenesis ATPase FlaH
MSNLESYFIHGYEPNAKTVHELFRDACEDLLVPTPSSKLNSFPLFMKMTNGLRPYEFTILCGSTGTGKTTLCANWSADLLRQGIPHFVASVETGHLDFIKRVMSVIAAQDWNTGSLVAPDAVKRFYAEYGSHFESDCLNLSLYDNRMSVETLMADLAVMVKKKNIKVAIIDNLNFFLEVTRSQDQVIEMDRVIHELIIFCKRVNIHLVMVMHPKKTTTDRVESEFDIKGSSTAVQEAHNIFLFNRPHPDLIKAGEATPSDREIFIAKVRRMGKYIRKRLLLGTDNGVKYFEKNVY